MQTGPNEHLEHDLFHVVPRVKKEAIALVASELIPRSPRTYRASFLANKRCRDSANALQLRQDQCCCGAIHAETW
jgi:hypothetical protein